MVIWYCTYLVDNFALEWTVIDGWGIFWGEIFRKLVSFSSYLWNKIQTPQLQMLHLTKYIKHFICNKCTSWCTLNSVKGFHGNALFKRERMLLFHILWCLGNSNLNFARSAILYILTQNSSSHTCAKFD